MKTTLAAALLCAGLIVPAGATIFNYEATLTGPNESPANASPGTGFATLSYDNSAHSLEVQVTFSGLTGTTTASHIHAATTSPGSGTAGVAVPFGNFPLGVTSGTFSGTIDLTQSSSWNSTYLTANGGTPSAAEAALATALASDESYWNIHSTTFGGGEIRGFLVPVPEPSSLALLGCAGAVFACWRRRRV